MSRPATTAYRLIEDWEQLPAGRVHRDVADVTVDAEDRVYLFTRMDPSVIVYDSSGAHVTSWGEDSFTPRPHGITAAHDGLIYCVDEYDQTVRTFTPDGEPIGVIGESGVDVGHRDRLEPLVQELQGAGGGHRSRRRPVQPSDEGRTGAERGCLRERRLRERSRSPFFARREPDSIVGEPGSGPASSARPTVWWSTATTSGCATETIERHTNLRNGRHTRRRVDARAAARRRSPSTRRVPSTLPSKVEGRRPLVSQRTDRRSAAGECVHPHLGRFGARTPRADEGFNFHAPHGLAVDSQGSIYVAEVLASWFRPDPVPAGTHTLHKLARA